MNYFSAHNHTEYSNLRLLDAINKPTKLIDRAIELGLKGLAITDHEVLSSHVEALQHYQDILKEEGLTPEEFKLVLGDEIYLVDDVLDIKKNYTSEKHYYYHFVLLAKDKQGYRQIKEISSTAWSNAYTQRGMERVPIDKKQLAEIIGDNKGHIAASTACLGGELPKLILKLTTAEKEFGHDSPQAYTIKSQINDFIMFCKNLFGDDFYFEVQPSNCEDQIIVNTRMKSLSEFYNVKMIFTTDSHYLRKEDAPIHKAYLNSKDGEREVDDFYATAYMMEEEEVYSYLKDYFTLSEFRQMVKNSQDLADGCEVYNLSHKQVIPEINVKERLAALKKKYPTLQRDEWTRKYEYIRCMIESESIQDRYWIYSCVDGMTKRIIGKPVANQIDVYWERVNMEAKELWGISEIIEDRMSKYYNTMQTIIELVWDKGNSLVGPARGSATGLR